MMSAHVLIGYADTTSFISVTVRSSHVYLSPKLLLVGVIKKFMYYVFSVCYIEDLTLVVISYEIYKAVFGESVRYC